MNKIELIEWKNIYDWENGRWITLEDIETKRGSVNNIEVVDDEGENAE